MASASPTSAPMNSGICDAPSMKWKLPPPASATWASRCSSKSEPTPSAEVLTRRCRSAATLEAISSGEVIPWLARPSVSSRQRPTASSRSARPTSSHPASQPACRSVLPRSPMPAILSSASALASGVARLDGTTTSTWSSYATTAKRSSARSARIPWIAASRALRILSPAIDPERSMTKARLTGIRSARRGASGAVISTRTNRRLGAVARIRRRSARTENGMVPPRGLQMVPWRRSPRSASRARGEARRLAPSTRGAPGRGPRRRRAPPRSVRPSTRPTARPAPCSKPRSNARAASPWRPVSK